MIYYYAQLDDNDYVTGISRLTGPVAAPHMIEIPAEDAAKTGQWYNRSTDEFETV